MKYADEHPGGKFLITHNTGRDISKFFFGGYSLEDNLSGPKPAQGHTHSAYARMIVNNLAVARYSPGTTCSTTICNVVEAECTNVNASTKTMVLQNVDKQYVTNFKEHFTDSDCLTKHFRISSLEGSKSISRHYTICSAMEPSMYKAYLKALKPEDDPEYARMDRRQIMDDDCDKMAFCIKNYDTNGLSQKLFEAGN